MYMLSFGRFYLAHFVGTCTASVSNSNSIRAWRVEDAVARSGSGRHVESTAVHLHYIWLNLEKDRTRRPNARGPRGEGRASAVAHTALPLERVEARRVRESGTPAAARSGRAMPLPTDARDGFFASGLVGDA